jgi:hypothetical protein
MAGIQALINRRLAGRRRLAPVYYQLAAAE